MNVWLRNLAIFAACTWILALTQPAQAAGSRKFCMNWTYQYNDQGLGEDYLLHQHGNYGATDAAYFKSEVRKGTSVIWSGYLDSNGCTPSLTGASGTFYVYLYTEANRSDGARFLVLDNSTNQSLLVYGWGVTLNAVSSGTIIHNKDMGFIGSSMVNVSAIVARFLSTVGGITGDQVYRIMTLENCPSVPGSACFSPNTDAVYLGSDGNGDKANRKFLVAHEMGHNLQYRLFGLSGTNYSLVTAYALCTCDHVPDSNLRAHCLQSKEYSHSAQSEGYAHFYAALAFNNTTQSNATFNYYKHFKEPGLPVTSPPNAWDVYGGDAPYRWKDNHCPSSGTHGTELDWMTLYYELVNKGSSRYSFSDLKTLYTEVCDGNCNSQDSFSWSKVLNAAISVWGVTSGKADYLADLGAKHGVD